MSDVSGSWHPDPFGRFAQRYHDGTQWTEHVVDASGAQSTDPPVTTPTPAAAAPPTTGGYGAPPTAGYGAPPAYGAPTATTTGAGAGLAIGPGLIVAAAGVLLVILSVFALGWISGENAQTGKDETINMADVRDANDGLEQVNREYGVIPALYIDFLYLLGIVAAGLAVVATLNSNLSKTLKLPALIAAGVFLILHVYAAFNANTQISDANEDFGAEGTSIAIGVYVGAIGYIAAMVGAFLGPKPD